MTMYYTMTCTNLLLQFYYHINFTGFFQKKMPVIPSQKILINITFLSIRKSVTISHRKFSCKTALVF